MIQFGFKAILASTKPKQFQNLSINQYLNGYTDAFLNLAGKIVTFDPAYIGFLSARKALAGNRLTIFTGREKYSDAGRVFSFDGRKEFDIWKTNECNTISGSHIFIDGFYEVQNKMIVQNFVPEVCRALPMKFVQEENIGYGMRTYRYKPMYEEFWAPRTHIENKYYCELKSMNEEHIGGILGISDCLEGKPPIFFSPPHFHGGDQKLFEHFDGVEPNEKLHTGVFNLHPRFGVPLSFTIQLQLSVRPSTFGIYYKNLPKGIILPMIWMSATLDEFDDPTKFKIFASTVLLDYFEVFLKFGSIVAIVSFLCSMYK